MNKGFTLLELAIVLVVVGLLAGGIVGGQSLIKTSRMNEVVSGFQKYKTAYDVFREKYHALPGDMPDSETYWSNIGWMANGDGDGVICDPTGAAGTAWTWEIDGFWPLLEAADLVDVYGDARYDSPVGPFRNSYWVPMRIGENYECQRTPADGDLYDDDKINKHYISLVGSGGSSTLEPSNISMSGDVFDGEMAYWLDNKLDDGRPNFGMIISYKGRIDNSTYMAGCTDIEPTGVADYVATPPSYDLTDETKGCHVLYLID